MSGAERILMPRPEGETSCLRCGGMAAELRVLLCSVFMVFEYCEHDMGRLLDTMKQPFSEAEVKCLMQQVRSSFSLPFPSTASLDLPGRGTSAWKFMKRVPSSPRRGF